MKILLGIIAVIAAFLALAIICAVAIARGRSDAFDELVPLPSGSLPEGSVAERSPAERGGGFSARELRQFRGGRR